jgi:amino acid adenylation domain-containing protein
VDAVHTQMCGLSGWETIAAKLPAGAEAPPTAAAVAAAVLITTTRCGFFADAVAVDGGHAGEPASLAGVALGTKTIGMLVAEIETLLAGPRDAPERREPGPGATVLVCEPGRLDRWAARAPGEAGHVAGRAEPSGRSYTRLVAATAGSAFAAFPARSAAREEAVAFLRTLVHVIDQVCRRMADGAQAASVDLVPDRMRRLILGGFNSERQALPADSTVPDMIARHVATSPGDTAIVLGDESLSYRGLGLRAEALADALTDAGIVKGDVVGLLLGNSLSLPIAMLGCMRAAAVFVPMDTSWPAGRLESFMRSLKPSALIAPGSGAPLPVYQGPVIREPVAAGSADHPDPQRVGATLDDIAYGYPTSASTGPPKCPLNTHRGLLNRFLYMSGRFGAGRDTVVLQNSRPVFDSSLWQLLWPLTNGARVIIPEPRDRLDLAATVELIRSRRVTMTDFVPSIFNALVTHLEANPGEAASLVSLRHVLIGGEEISPGHCDRFRALCPNVILTNTYGPTEAAIGMVFHEVSPRDGRRIPIGRPIANTCAVVLDERLQILPLGATGELFIGGACLGVGYANDTAATARAWVSNPFPELDTPRLYRTGDRVRQGPDGTLYFIGRGDRQVKVGGVRIELGEIEHALAAHPAVDGAAVVVQKLAARPQLTAYVTCRAPIRREDLARHLGELLPATSIPGDFVVLDEFPLTHNGKLDRRALTERERPTVNGTNGEDPQEQLLRELWAEILGPRSFSATDDFFAVGGDSLAAVYLLAGIEEKAGVRLPFRVIYDAPTIAGLAQAIRAGGEVTDGGDALDRVNALADRDRRLLGRLDPASALPPRSAGRGVVVTGATGFVGCHVAAALLETAGTDLTFVSRDRTLSAAADRLHEAMSGYGLWRPSFHGRLWPVLADLERPDLGRRGELAEAIAASAAVVNCAGVVDFLHGYDRHRPVNVVAVAQLIELCARTGTSFHQLSTLGATARPPTAAGYMLSKWVAEAVADSARQRGAHITVYRVGEVMPHSELGVPNDVALSWMLLRACALMSVFPRDAVTFDYSPVDWVADAIARSVTSRDGRDATFEVHHRRRARLDDLVASLTATPVRAVEPEEFWATLRDRCDRDGTGVLHRLRCLLECARDQAGPRASTEDVFRGLFEIPGSRAPGVGQRTPTVRRIGQNWPDIDRRILGAFAHRLACTPASV